MKRGDLPGAAAALARAGISDNERPRSLLLVRFLDIRGCVRRAQGDPAAALGDFLAISDVIEPAGCKNPAIAHLRSEAALALLQLGQRDQARWLAREELPAENNQWRTHLPPAQLTSRPTDCQR